MIGPMNNQLTLFIKKTVHAPVLKHCCDVIPLFSQSKIFTSDSSCFKIIIFLLNNEKFVKNYQYINTSEYEISGADGAK